nr:MAG TPA: hypothetical protein [Caudoviricetes sp.]
MLDDNRSHQAKKSHFVTVFLVFLTTKKFTNKQKVL